jgi:hypothetical protein
MACSGMLCRMALVRTDVSEELSASVIRVTRIGELGILIFSSQRASVASFGYVVPSSPNLVTLMKETLGSSDTSVLRRATQRNIPEDGILHSHCRENLKFYDCKLSSVKRNQLSSVNYRNAISNHSNFTVFCDVLNDALNTGATSCRMVLNWKGIKGGESCITRSFIICTLRQV